MSTVSERHRSRAGTTSFSTAYVSGGETAGSRIAYVRKWTEDEFLNSEVEWQDLLDRSDANPLFMSWIWQAVWWRCHAASLKSRLVIYAAYSSDGQLIGIAPFHAREVTHRLLFGGTRLELLGSSFRTPAGIFSEYLDFVVDRRFVAMFLCELKAELLRDMQWTDFVLANTSHNSVAAQFARENLDAGNYQRKPDVLVAHISYLPEHFGDYLSKLSANVRRKLWNHRTRLAAPRLAEVEKGDIAQFVDRLISLHKQRWGTDPFQELRRAFYLEVAERFADKNQLRMSYLFHDGEPISLMFNVRINETEYNLQSGFDRNVAVHVSPGYLHFGYTLEEAQVSGVKQFNFLAGFGRSRDYKQDFITTPQELTTFHTILSRPLAWLYRCYDRRLLYAAGSCLPYLIALGDAPYVDLPIAY